MRAALLTFASACKKIKPHPKKAQILLELNDTNQTLEKALLQLKALERHPIDYRYIQKEPPILVLLYMYADVKNATVILADIGFCKIKGINTAPKKPEKK